MILIFGSIHFYCFGEKTLAGTGLVRLLFLQNRHCFSHRLFVVFVFESWKMKRIAQKKDKGMIHLIYHLKSRERQRFERKKAIE